MKKGIWTFNFLSDCQNLIVLFDPVNTNNKRITYT